MVHTFLEDANFQVPCTVAYEWITPETAKHMLDGGSGARRNRKVAAPVVKRYQGIIRRGEWMYDSTDAIGIAVDGGVVNGGHRLTAISEGDFGVWALVVRNVRPEVIKVIDQPSMRNLTQALDIDGRYPETGVLASAIKETYKLMHGFKKTVPAEYKPTIPQELELLTQHRHLVDSLSMAAKVYKNPYKVLPKGAWTALHYAFSCADAELADQFITQLATGEDINDGDPVYLLRERLFITEPGKSIDTRKRTLDNWETEYLIILAWEVTRAERRLTTKETGLLKTRFPLAAAAMPHITGVAWLEQGA